MARQRHRGDSPPAVRFDEIQLEEGQFLVARRPGPVEDEEVGATGARFERVAGRQEDTGSLRDSVVDGDAGRAPFRVAIEPRGEMQRQIAHFGVGPWGERPQA